MKIAIMGSAPSSRKLAPFNDLEWEVWSCSPPNFDLPRVDAWFELHELKRKFEHKQNGPYINTLINHPRVYVTQPDPRLPNALQFPWGKILNEYGPYWLTSSIALMMAYAILVKKPTKIGLWGVDMAATEEYSFQRPGCWYFIEKAREAGIEVCIPPQSDLLAPVPVYGLREFWPMWHKLNARRKELEERLSVAERAEDGASRDALVLKGALDDLRYSQNTWVLPTPEWRNLIETQEEPVDSFIHNLVANSEAKDGTVQE